MGGVTQEIEDEVVDEEEEETQWTCPVCSNDEEDEAIDDGDACLQCSFICPECENVQDHDDGMKIATGPYRGELGCSSCFTSCDSCNGVVLNTDVVSNESGEGYCASCYSELYTTCYSCDDECSRDGLYYCSSCCEYFCESCWSVGRDGECNDCSSSENELLQEYDYSGSLHYLSLPDEPTITHRRHLLYFGVELEMDGGNLAPTIEELTPLTPDDSLFWMKEDGSLGSNGIEIATQPASMAYHREKFPWQKICSAGRSNGYKSHDTGCCGLHIHVSRRGMQEGERIKLALFVYSHHKQMITFARRNDNGYSAFKPTSDAIQEKGRTSSRYEAVNFIPHHTIEFRLFRGTLRPQTILAAIQFCHALCFFVRKESFPHVVQPLAWMRYIAFVRGHSSDYPELLSYLETRGLT